MRDWSCWHVPGMTYEIKDASADSTTVRTTLCTALVKNAHLAEVSAVYDGATPGAAVLQAQRAAEAGRLGPEQARLIEQRYRIHLPGKRLAIQGGTMPTPEHNGNGKEPAATPDLRLIQQTLERAGCSPDLLIPAGVEWLAGEITRLTPLAQDGTQYRTDLVALGVAEAVRAFGAEAGAKKEAMLATASLETIKEFTSSWRDIGDVKLPGGRTTTDESNEETPAGWRKVNAAHLHG